MDNIDTKPVFIKVMANAPDLRGRGGEKQTHLLVPLSAIIALNEVIQGQYDVILKDEYSVKLAQLKYSKIFTNSILTKHLSIIIP